MSKNGTMVNVIFFLALLIYSGCYVFELFNGFPMLTITVSASILSFIVLLVSMILIFRKGRRSTNFSADSSD